MRIFYCFLLLLISLGNLPAQDPRFSQFYAAPLDLNPAMTGIFDGKYRLALNYRTQWASILDNRPYRTFAGSFDIRYNLFKSDFLSAGLVAMRDAAGDSRLSMTRTNLSLAYLKQLSGGKYRKDAQYLSAGFQVGGGQYSVDYSNLWFSRQFDLAAEKPDLGAGSGEAFTGKTTGNFYLDFNVGLMWYAVFDHNLSLWAGGSYQHINEPNIAFYDGAKDPLYGKFVGHIGGQIPLGEYLSMLPAVVVASQGPSQMVHAGANVRYSNNDRNELAIRAGLWPYFANSLDGGLGLNAWIVTGVLEYNRFQFGLSYDIQGAGLRAPTNSRGAFELSLIYTGTAEKRLRVTCPTF